MDGTNLKTSREVVVVDTMHLEDMVQGNENLSDLPYTQTPSCQGNIDMNCEDESNSTDIFCQEDRQEEELADVNFFGRSSIVVIDSDLLSFNASDIQDMQVLWFVPTEAQQVMNLSESLANITQNNEIVDLDENISEPFQLVVPRKKKNKKKQLKANKGFKVGASGCSPH